MKTVLQVESRIVNYHIPIESKYTIIRGDSGTGKTTLINMLRQPAIQKTCGYRILPLPLDAGDYSKNMKEYLDGLSKETALLYGDEDLPYLKSVEFQDAMQRCKHLFLLVTRTKLAGVPYSNLDIWELQRRGKVNKAVRMYEKQDKVRWGKVSKVVTEDAKSGCEFFQSVFSETKSANGKDNISKMILSSQRALLIVDGLGAGAVMQDIVLALTESPSNQVAIIGSFECMVYQSELINGQETPTVECPNQEEFYTEMLSQEFARNGLKYDKGKCSSCLTRDCCFKGKKCSLHKRGRKQRIVLGQSALEGLLSVGSIEKTDCFQGIEE